MKIKLIHFPYYDHSVGEIVDFGEEINASLVSFNRAVWVEPKKSPLKEVIKDVVEAVTQPHPPKKRLITNSLREKVQVAKKKKNLNDDIDA